MILTKPQINFLHQKTEGYRAGNVYALDLEDTNELLFNVYNVQYKVDVFGNWEAIAISTGRLIDSGRAYDLGG